MFSKMDYFWLASLVAVRFPTSAIGYGDAGCLARVIRVGVRSWLSSGDI